MDRRRRAWFWVMLQLLAACLPVSVRLFAQIPAAAAFAEAGNRHSKLVAYALQFFGSILDQINIIGPIIEGENIDMYTATVVL